MKQKIKCTELIKRIKIIDPNLADAIYRIERGWETDEPADSIMTENIAETITKCINANIFTAENMVSGFNEFSHEFFDLQMEAIRNQKYKATDYEAIRKKIYANNDYMEKTYYPALLLGYLASPNYRHILRSFEKVVRNWANIVDLKIIDVASGHGLLLLYALKTISNSTGVAIDISPIAEKFAKQLQACTGWGELRFSSKTEDLLSEKLTNDSETYNAAICCELLEHIPHPEKILARLRNKLNHNGRLFISVAVRMESVDHLTYFGSTKEVETMLRNEGFTILKEYSVPFVTSRPNNEEHWHRLLEDPYTPVTYIAECGI
jgi:2-polyprenyl-3-methyl-5-hydroxy-6-metoxy-1,4-benzoquinol methylase